MAVKLGSGEGGGVYKASAASMQPPDLSHFMRQDSAVRNRFANDSAQNTFNKNRALTQHGNAMADFNRGFKRQLPGFSASFGRRGLAGGGIKSGVMGRAMNNFVGDYTREVGRAQQNQFDDMQQFDFNQSRFAADRDSALADIEAQKAATIAQTAAQISALQPYMGGF
jgi:hypothetical protein